MPEFDLIVIGGGTGNNVASAAADHGFDVALIEEGRLGGTCLTRGCDPSKVLVQRADLIEEIERSEAFGVDATIDGIDFDAIVGAATDPFDERADEMAASMRDAENLTLVRERARFVGERTVEAGDRELFAENVVVAVGARPAIPDAISGIDDVAYVTSDEALRLDERPDHLVVIGGGYVAAEMAHVYEALGADVTVVGRAETLLPEEDRDVRATVTEALGRRCDLLVGHEATAVGQDGDEITVRAERVGDEGGNGTEEDGDRERDEITVTGDELLVAAGRRPNADRLDVAAAGIETDDDGFVVVDDRLRTTAEGVWALGDVVGDHPFWHAAYREAKCVDENVVHDAGREIDYPGMAHAVFTEPQVASTGATEQELEDEGRAYVAGRYEYADAAMGIALRAEDGFAKVLADPDDGEILGCHVVGPEAATLLHEVSVALASGSGTVEDITGTIHVHPALSEVVARAFDDVGRDGGGEI